AYKEAVKKHLPIVAVCDTNVNPTDVDYMIPANDDAVKSIDMISGLVAQAILEGKKLALTNKAAMTAAKEAKEKEEAEFAAKAAAETATTEPAAE
ncbi:MAG: 30S ribosomal protein S2, partial [Patescibacteria group bacterium]